MDPPDLSVAISVTDADHILTFLEEMRDLFQELPSHIEEAWSRLNATAHPDED